MGSPMIALLPAFTWLVALFWAIGICAICLISGEFTYSLVSKPRPHKVQPVSWTVVAMQLLSGVLCLIPYALYIYTHDQYARGVSALYASFGLPSAVVLFILLAIQITLMYGQAKRAYRDTMDARIGSHRSDTDI